MAELTVAPNPNNLICDCCNAPNPTWDYDTGGDIVQEAWVESGPKMGPDLVYDHIWVVCDVCAALVDAGKYKELRARAWASYLAARGTGFPAEGLELSQRLIDGLYDQLEKDGMKPCFWCPGCKRVSYHPNDRAQRYCGNCHKFYERKA
jgi:hypothetical protein